jgi:putative membrane protein
MSIRRLMTVAGGLALSLAAIPAPALHAQAKDDVKADSKWIREVAADNMLEVDLAKVAERRATNAAVKQFAQRMDTDHNRANDDLRSMASSHGFPFKPELGRKHEAKVDQLQKSTSKEFDRAYMRSMVQNHTDDVAYFENEGMHAQSAPVRDYAAKYLPMLQQHLTLARQVAGQVGADTTLANHARRTTAKRK